jgi:hypothetical protein
VTYDANLHAKLRRRYRRDCGAKVEARSDHAANYPSFCYVAGLVETSIDDVVAAIDV